jgi:preprotein translocase subunit YajC
MFTDLAYAMGILPGGGGGTGGSGGLGSFLPLILMFVVFYFLLIWPQQKKSKAHRQVLASLQKGDSIVTSSGIYGTITGITDTVVTLEIAEKVRIKVARSSVAGKVQSQV